MSGPMRARLFERIKATGIILSQPNRQQNSILNRVLPIFLPKTDIFNDVNPSSNTCRACEALAHRGRWGPIGSYEAPWALRALQGPIGQGALRAPYGPYIGPYTSKALLAKAPIGPYKGPMGITSPYLFPKSPPSIRRRSFTCVSAL